MIPRGGGGGETTLRRDTGAFDATDRLMALALGLCAALICLAALVRRPDLNSSNAFLFGDPGANLLLAEKLSNGARLFRDAGYSYGPLSIYPYRWFASVFGNTPQSFSAFLALFSVTNVCVVYRLLRAHVTRATALVVTIAAVFPTVLLPGSLIFGIQASPYFVLERLLLLSVVLSWRVPEARRPRHAIAIGVLLGLWQGVRFGSAFFVGAAIVIVDLLYLSVSSVDRVRLGQWLRASVVTLLSFLAIEAAWIIGAFALLPAGDARDFLWPAYVLEAFEVWPQERRWPRYANVRLLLGQQLVAIGCAILGAIALYRLVRDWRATVKGTQSVGWHVYAGDFCLLIPFVFYAMGAAGLFRSVYHFHQYAWTLPLAAALAVDRGGRRMLAGFLLVSLPGLALMLRANFVTSPPASAVTVEPPAGGHLVLSETEKARTQALLAVATGPVPRKLLIMRVGAGFHYLFRTPVTGRQIFYILGFARGDDAEIMLRTLSSEPSAFVLTDYPPGERPPPDPCQWYGWRHFAPEVCARVAPLVDVGRAFRVDESTWIIPSTSVAPPPVGGPSR